MKTTVEVKEYNGFPVGIIRLGRKMEILSSAVMNSGHAITDTMMIMEVPKRYDSMDPLSDMEEVCAKLSLPKDTVGFMTAAEVDDVITLTEMSHGRSNACVVATAGLSNKVIAGDIIYDMEDRLDHSDEMRKKRSMHYGTINIIGIVDTPLSDSAKVNSFITMTEAKTAAMQSLGHLETGTTSDAIAIVSPIGDKKEIYCGTSTDMGIALSRAVRESVCSALIKREDFPEIGTFMDVMKPFGVTRENMWDAAFELYNPNPIWDTDKIKKMFMRSIDIYSKDINISSLVQAAAELEKLGGKDCICAMPRGMYATDPIHLIADEFIGIQIAEYIGGSRAMFEFNRFDRHKPGIIGKLGPFMDDTVCGLVGGIMSSIYTKLFEDDIK